MRKIILIWCLLCGAMQMQAQNAQETLKQGEELYKQEKYREAFTFLENNKHYFVEGQPDYAKLSRITGKIYEAEKDYTKAETCYLEAKVIFEKTLGKEHYLYDVSLVDLGFLYESMKKYPEAEEYYLEVKIIREKKLGERPINYIVYAVALKSLGRLYHVMGDSEKAKQYQSEAAVAEEHYKTITQQSSGEKNDPGRILQQAKELYDRGKYLDCLLLMEENKSMIETAGGKEYSEALSMMGYMYTRTGNFAEAEKCLSAAKFEEEKTGKESETLIAVLNRLGNLYIETAKFEDAKKILADTKKRQETSRRTKTPNYAATLEYLGLLHNVSENHKEAEKYYRQAKALRKEISGKDHPDYATVLDRMGAMYHNAGNFSEAGEYYVEAMDVREKTIGDKHPDYANSLSNLGVLLLYAGQPKRDFLIYANMLREKTVGKDSPEYTATLLYIGYSYYLEGNYREAEDYYLAVMSVEKRTLGVEHPNYVTNLEYLGGLYKKTGNYREAEKCLKETLKVRERTLGKNHDDYSNTLSSLGDVYFRLGGYDKALEFYFEAESIREKNNTQNHPNYASILNNIGQVMYVCGKYTDAEEFWLLTMSYIESSLGKKHADYAACLGNLGALYQKTGNYDRAEKYLSEALQLKKKINGNELATLNNLGDLYHTTGNYAKAETHFLDAYNILNKAEGRDHPDYMDIVSNLGALYLSSGNYLKSGTWQNEVDRILISRVNKNFAFLSEQQRGAFWDDNKHRFNVSYSLAYRRSANDIVAQSYDNILFAKGLLLRTANGIRDAVYASGNMGLIDKYEQAGKLRQQINLLQSEENPDINTIKILEDDVENLDKELTAASNEYKDAKADISTSWQNIQAALQPGEVAVEFVDFELFDKVWTDSTFYCAMILKKDSKSPVWIPLCEERQLQTLTKRTGDIQEYTQTLYSDAKGAELYRLIWQPLEKELKGGRTVYYSPSGMLHQIAFAALPATGGVLSDKYDLQLVSSTREIARLKKEKSGTLPQGTAAVYGGLWYDADKDRLIAEAKKPGPGLTLPQREETQIMTIAAVLPKDQKRGRSWDYLAGTETEAKQICGYLNEQKISNRLYTETAGNEESFKRLSGTSAGIIHLATHGFFLEDAKDESNREVMRTLGGNNRQAFENPLLRSGLLMSGANRAWTNEDVIEDIEDGILTADEIARMNLIKTRLVVLSACETGLGEVKSAEGVFGLQRAFKLAGAETLVMSLWTVPDDATSELMSAFYKLWISGKTKREAFASAQKSVREKYKEPFYWAGFVMMD